MERLRGRVALVTGASAGIGAGLVKSLVKHGMKVVGCARNIENLQKLRDELSEEPGVMVPIQCDVSKPEEILSMFDAIKADPQLGGVDICINSAGLAHSDSLLTGDYYKWKEMIDVNVLGLCLCTREAYKSMKERNVDDGHIILLNSLAGHVIVNDSAFHVYTVTKHAVTAITEGVRQELREEKSGIRVTAVSPGLVDTEFIAKLTKCDTTPQAYYNLKCLEVEDIVNTVLFVLQAPSHVQVHDIVMRSKEQRS